MYLICLKVTDFEAICTICPVGKRSTVISLESNNFQLKLKLKSYDVFIMVKYDKIIGRYLLLLIIGV